MNVIQEDVGVPDVFSGSGVCSGEFDSRYPQCIKEGSVSWLARNTTFSTHH